MDYEIRRQIKTLAKGERIIQETRTWDEHEQVTMSMRSKEEAHDYRYFPDPDLPPLRIDPAWVERVQEPPNSPTVLPVGGIQPETV